jgi:hypothetical protein
LPFTSERIALGFVASVRFGHMPAVMRCLDEVGMQLVNQLRIRLDSGIRLARHGVRTAGAELEPQERLTLEIGSWVIVGALGLGLQVGNWSAWSALAALAGYLAWVVIYSEATVQARRFQMPRLVGVSSANSAPPPSDEQ